MQKGELILNLAIGFSIIIWGWNGFYLHYLNGEPSLIRLVISLLNLCIGVLIIFRRPVRKMESLISVIISIPSLIFGGLIFKMAHPFNLWSTYVEITFVTGALFTLVSFIFLGRNFSIFPEVRSIISKGTYNIIRHPGYLGELTMIFAFAISKINLIPGILFVFFVFSLWLRIHEEEKVLSQHRDYLTYKEKVKWKLFPYLW